MSGVYDPVAEAQQQGLFSTQVAAYGVIQVTAKGTEIGWYLRPDGQAVRLPWDMESRDHYEKKGFKPMREWGVYSRHPVMTNRGELQPEEQWAQLDRLSREHPDPVQRALIEEALGKVFAAASSRVALVLTCACGQVYNSDTSFKNHQRGCRAVAQPVPPDDAPVPAAPLSPAADASEGGTIPTVTLEFKCDQCPKSFETKPQLTGHLGAHRPRRKRR